MARQNTATVQLIESEVSEAADELIYDNGETGAEREAGTTHLDHGESQQQKEQLGTSGPDLASRYAHLGTKSAKIRAMAADGYTTSQIAKSLGIIYQHARNVLKAPPPKRVAQPAVTASTASTASAPVTPVVRIGNRFVAGTAEELVDLREVDESLLA